jgi:hypothetical protein
MSLKFGKVERMFVDGKEIDISNIKPELLMIDHGINEEPSKDMIQLGLDKLSVSWELNLTKAEVAILQLYIAWLHICENWYGYGLWLAPTYVDLRLMLTAMNYEVVRMWTEVEVKDD